MTTKTLKGRTALVTGSTSGIGLGIAELFAQNGADIWLNGFGDAGEIEKIRDGLEQKHGVKVRYANADLTKPVEIDRLVTEIGAVDILVNNAGVQHTAPIHEFPDDKWDLLIAILLSAPFHLTKRFLPGMQQKGWGRIVNIASVHGQVGSANKGPYVAAKHGLIGFSKVVALENANNGITCNTICPGWVLTPLVQKQIDAMAERDGLSNEEASRKLLSEKQPMHQFTQPEQIGEAALFLCSDAARTMTGVALTIDGGWTAQ